MRNGVLQKTNTTRTTRSISVYLHDISNLPSLSIEEEIEILKEIKRGNKSAYQKLIEANLRFVVAVAKQYQNQGLLLIDLISEGNLGLLIAAKKFDETKGFKFITYAIWWIRQSIILAINQNRDTVRLPSNKIHLSKKIHKIQQKFENTNSREISTEELSEISKIPIKTINEILSLKKTISFDKPITNNDEDITVIDTYQTFEDIPDKEITQKTQSNFFKTILLHLKEKEQEVLTYYFGLDENPPLSYTEIGAKLNYSTENVRRIKKRALIKLQKQLEGKEYFCENYI